MKTTFVVDNKPARPTSRQRVGVWLINAGSAIINKAFAKSVIYTHTSASLNEMQEKYDDLLASIYLYIDWKYVTKQLTTEQKTLFADAVDRDEARMDAEEGRDLEKDPRTLVPRWWTDDYQMTEVDWIAQEVQEVIKEPKYSVRLHRGVELLKQIDRMLRDAESPAAEALTEQKIRLAEKAIFKIERGKK